MDSYGKVNRYFDLISIGISAIITKIISDSLTQLKIQQLIILCIIFITIYLLNEFFTGIFKKIFSSFTLLRKYTLGDEFVEGIWVEFLTENNKLESVGITLIKPDKEGYGLRLSGENYQYNVNNSNHELSLRYRFYSKDGLTKIKFPILEFAYVNSLCVPINGKNLIEGVGKLTFSSIQGTPSRYHASFNLAEDARTVGTVGLESWKIQDGNDLKQIKNDSKNTVKILIKYIAQREKEKTT